MEMPNGFSDELNPGVYSKDSSPFNVPYGDWIARWWQWTSSIPAAEHPRDNYTPDKCAAGQSGPVWFLADQLGGEEERTCTIPSGKAILVPILTGQCDYTAIEIKNDEELKRCSTEGDEYGVITASIDGKEVKNLNSYRTQSGFFNITNAKDNIYDAPAGTYRAWAEGFFVFLEPMQNGKHTVSLSASVLNPVQPQYNYNAKWTYHLIIGP